MYTNRAHGDFELFNCNTHDGYLALRCSNDRHWQLYRLTPDADGFHLETMGHHSSIGQVDRVAEADASRREKVRHSG